MSVASYLSGCELDLFDWLLAGYAQSAIRLLKPQRNHVGGNFGGPIDYGCPGADCGQRKGLTGDKTCYLSAGLKLDDTFGNQPERWFSAFQVHGAVRVDRVAVDFSFFGVEFRQA